MRRVDIDTGGQVWVYRPRQHKNRSRGHVREIYLGPKAQQVVQEFFGPSLDAYLFSPRLAREERYRCLRAKRKSRIPPSQVCRRKSNPEKRPGERYTPHSYRQAITKACRAVGVPPWHPHQLRHNAATSLRRDHGIELARVILGHRSAITTEIYADADREQAVAVMARIG
jgi:integrase